MIDVIQYISNIENEPSLGISEKIDVNKKSPIQIPNMNRQHLGRLFYKLGFKTGAEIGIERGLYSEQLCNANPDLKLYCIDAWTAYKGYREHVSQDKLDGFLEETKKRLSPYGCNVIKAFSMDAVKAFEDESLDFVYIDGNHEFQQTTNDIAEWSKKVRKGGIISGHDYSRIKGGNYICHVRDVVGAWAYAHQINPWFVIRGDRSPSWFWIK